MMEQIHIFLNGGSLVGHGIDKPFFFLAKQDFADPKHDLGTRNIWEISDIFEILEIWKTSDFFSIVSI